MIKFAHGCNHYDDRETLINKDATKQECTKFNETESWDHVIKCKHTRKMRVEHAKELTISFLQCKTGKQTQKKFCFFIEDILRHLENEKIEDQVTNQHLIVMKELFRGHIVKVWKGVDFREIKHSEVNKIVMIKCVECCVKFQKHRNECMHDKNK